LNVVALLALFAHNKQQPQICSMGQPAYVTAGKSLSHRLRAASLGEAETSHADVYTQSGIMVPAYEDAHHTKGPELYSTARALYPEFADDAVLMKPELDRSTKKQQSLEIGREKKRLIGCEQRKSGLIKRLRK
jgi:hypothetical protein